MQNWSCMHPCGHSSIKFLWSCDTRAQDSFSLFKSTYVSKIRSFINSCIHLSLFRAFGKIFTAIHPSDVLHTFSFKNWKLSLFKSILVFQLENLFFFFFLPFFLSLSFVYFFFLFVFFSFFFFFLSETSLSLSLRQPIICCLRINWF